MNSLRAIEERRMLVEYLYYDEKRLDSYLEQFASPVHFEKFSQWKASLNLAGPGAEGTQVGFARPLTKHEKVEGVIKFIVDQQLIAGDPERTDTDQFVDLTIRARRFAIPKENLAIWISMPELDNPREKRKRVFLIEDFRSKGGDQSDHYSGYSSLHILITALQDTEKNIPGVTRRERWDDANDRLEFANDPYGFLEKLGAKAGPAQTIRSIYKVRATAIEVEAKVGYVLAIVGYPIFIERSE